jgi:Cu(I)/Ag(I) efflux system protein CusF
MIHAFAAAAAFGAASALTVPAAAQMSHAHGAIATQAAASVQSADGAGEVRKIDVENRKVTLKHDAMKEMGMPAMTMVYPVADASVLRNIKVGEKVRFRAASAGGKTTITEMQAAQ